MLQCVVTHMSSHRGCCSDIYLNVPFIGLTWETSINFMLDTVQKVHKGG